MIKIKEIVMLGDYLSMTNLVSVLFLGYMGNNIVNLGKFWFPELCDENAKLKDCLRPMSFPEDQLFTAEIWFVRKLVEVDIYLENSYLRGLPIKAESLAEKALTLVSILHQ